MGNSVGLAHSEGDGKVIVKQQQLQADSSKSEAQPPKLSSESSNVTSKSSLDLQSKLSSESFNHAKKNLEKSLIFKKNDASSDRPKNHLVGVYFDEVSEEEKAKIFAEYPELKEALAYISRTLSQAYKTQDIDAMNKTMSMSVRKTFEEIYNYYFEFNKNVHRRLIGEKLANEGAARLIYTYMNVLTDEGRSYTFSGYKWDCVQVLRSVCWNYTDVSMKLSDEFGRAGLLALMYSDLKTFQSDYKTDEKKGFIALSAMSILYNCATSSANIKYFRSIPGVVDTVLWYSEDSKKTPHSNKIISALSMILLAYIVDDQQNELISADDHVITTIVQQVRGALSAADKKMDGFTASELVDGLKKLASHPRNSEVIMQKGVMVSLKKMLSSGSDDEKISAARLIWVLAFNDRNKDEITKVHQEVITILVEMRSQQENKNLRNVAAGALWLIEGKSSRVRRRREIKKKKPKKKKTDQPLELPKHMSMPQPVSSDDDDEEQVRESMSSSDDDEGTTTNTSKHVMISYQWFYQKLMIRIKSSLEERGFRVWMDVVEMGGSTLQKMADAVEKADVVLVGLSQRYKDSVSCRTEAEYAYKCNTDVIPLLLERDYKPDGWLGAILGTKFYFDFTNLSQFDVTFMSLQKELGNRGRLTIPELKAKGIEINEASLKTSLTPTSSSNTQINFVEWNMQQVQDWVSKRIYKKIKSKDLDGRGLSFLKRLKGEAPEFFYRHLSEQMQLRNLNDLLTFVQALEELE